MTNMEIAYMVAVLVLMSSDHFRDCTDYVKETDMRPEERKFMERVISISESKRKVRGLA